MLGSAASSKSSSYSTLQSRTGPAISKSLLPGSPKGTKYRSMEYPGVLGVMIMVLARIFVLEVLGTLG